MGRMSARRVGALLLAMAAVAALAVTVEVPAPAAADEPARPNIVFITVDDMRADEMWALPKTRALLEGTNFTNSTVSTSLCCPSRAAFLSGQYASNNRVPNNKSYGKFEHGNQVARWLQDSGYHTSIVGKYLNGYNCKKPQPAGWDDWQALCAKIYNGFGFSLKDNGTTVVYDKTVAADYQTDVLARRAVETIDDAAAQDDPFFLWVTPTAPHAGAGVAARHSKAYGTWQLPKGPSYDEADVSDKPAWVRNIAPFTKTKNTAILKAARVRLRKLLGIDDMVETIVAKLDATGQRENTMIVFTSDNGFMLGEHRVNQGKEVEFEESLRVPLLVSGPGVPVGDNPSPVMNIDHAASISELAGVTPGRVQDGTSWVPRLTDVGTSRRAVVHAGTFKQGTNADGPAHPEYKGVRAGRFTYFELATGEKELYNLTTDPHQLVNQAGLPRHAEVQAQLAAVLQPLKTCKGAACQVVVPNLEPTATATATCTDLTCDFSAAASSDPEGELTYAWDFGDESTGSGVAPSHAYAASGTYPVTLTVTDDEGATDVFATEVTVLAGNTPPEAAFTGSCTDLECSFDASTSFDPDPDGAITGYGWDFGDGETGEGPNPSHPYTLPGTYAVVLTVTDDRGGTGTVTVPFIVGGG